MTARRALLTGAVGLTWAMAARGQGWPDRPLRLVVPFPPGGPTDLVARPLAQRLTQTLGQPVIVENRGGAGGNLGAEAVAKAPPDGYTLLLSNVGVLTVNRFLYRNLSFDPERDFIPVALVAGAPVALIVHRDVPAHSLTEFVAWTKTQPSPVPYGTAGGGSPGHLAGEVFRSLTGAVLVHVPYRGSAPALQDVAAGHIAAMFDPVQSPLGQIQAGRVRALAISAPERSQVLPEVPTMAEAGVPDHLMVAWWAVVAPSATPAPVIARLATDIVRIGTAPEWQAMLARQGISSMLRGPAELSTFLREETERWGAAVRASGATAD